MSRFSESLKAVGRDVIRAYLRSPLRGKTRLRSIVDPWLAPAGGIELCSVGPCRIPLSHAHEATRNMAYGSYELEEISALRHFVKPGDVVVDVDANVGYFAANLAGMVGPKGKVYAFEPGPTPLSFLRQTAVSNSYGNIEVVGTAVSDRIGETVFFETQSILSRGYRRIDKRPSERFPAVKECRVPVMTIDAFFCERDSARLSFIKLDVEGQEKNVIFGMVGLLTERRPTIMTEITMNETGIEELKTYSTLLAGYGYRMHRFGGKLTEIDVASLKNGFHGNVLWIAGN